MMWASDKYSVSIIMINTRLMTESAIFVLIASTILAQILLFLKIYNPYVFFVIIFACLIPGLYATISAAPFVPSNRKRRSIMMKLANIGNQDIVYDLGCGDGRFVFEASKKAKKAIGYELSIPLYLLGKIRSLFYKKKAKIRFGDFFKQDLSDADIIFCYLMPKAIQRFYKELWPTLKPGTRFITNQFPIKNLQPVQTKDKVYMYIV